MHRFRPFSHIAAVAALSVAGPALAHTRVVSSTPAAAATVSNVRTVTLSFNEAVVPALSGLAIVMTGMPGMEGQHPPMPVMGVKVAPSADRLSLVATLPRPLAAGTYDVNWHAVGGDSHRMTGKVSFTVR